MKQTWSSCWSIMVFNRDPLSRLWPYWAKWEILTQFQKLTKSTIIGCNIMVNPPSYTTSFTLILLTSTRSGIGWAWRTGCFSWSGAIFPVIRKLSALNTTFSFSLSLLSSRTLKLSSSASSSNWAFGNRKSSSFTLPR